MKDYMRLALIVALFITGSAVESCNADEYFYDHHGNRRVVIIEPAEVSAWRKAGAVAATILLHRLSTGAARQNTQNYFNNQNQRNQMNHGAGGCTPNHSTGGCL